MQKGFLARLRSGILSTEGFAEKFLGAAFSPKGAVPSRSPGPARLREILVNVIAPFFAARAMRNLDASLMRAAAGLYFQGAASTNTKTRSLGFLLQGQGAVTSSEQQGLIELHDTLCAGLQCAACVIGSHIRYSGAL